MTASHGPSDRRSGRKPQDSIVAACEGYLERYGDSHLGVGWTKSQGDADLRYDVMLGVVRESDTEISLLDFGCGLSHLYEHTLATGRRRIRYSGLDLSERFLELSRAKFPDVDYYLLDLLERPDALPSFDYVIANGVFTQKVDNAFDAMWRYFTELVLAIFAKAKRGIAFNVMSTQVDWQRDDLFYLPFDALAAFLTSEVSRHFVVRHDYGLYEYTVYVYRRG